MQYTRLMLILTVTIFTLGLGACAPQGPVAQMTDPMFDFGEMDQNDSVTHVFSLKNVGDQELEITRTRSTCGCTVAKPSKNLLQPGDISEIKVIFSSGRRRGKQTKKVTVYTNDPNTEKVTLTLSGMVLERLTFEPARLRIKNIEPGVEKELNVTVTNAGNDTVAIEKIKINQTESISLKADENSPPPAPFKLVPKESKELTFILKLTEDQKYFHGRVEFILSGTKPPVVYYMSATQKGAIRTVKKPSGFGKKKGAFLKKKGGSNSSGASVTSKSGITMKTVKVKKDKNTDK